MKKIFALLVAVLSYSFTFSQEAEVVDNTPQFVISPRLDLNPYASTNGRGGKFDWSNSSLYTFLDGSVGEHFSYSVCNHWLSTDPKSLYQGTFRSDMLSWIDWANITLSFGKFDFTLGKDVLALGNYEEDANDVDSHFNMSSFFWNMAQIYQWGASATINTDEDSSIQLQFATSPFAERPFAGKLFTYSLRWRGTYGCFSPLYSVNFMEYERGKFLNFVALGNRFEFGNATIDLDYMNRASTIKKFFSQEMTLTAKFNYNFNDKVDLFVKGGYEFNHSENDFFGYEFPDGELDFNGLTPSTLCGHKDYVFYGAGVHYYPLRDSQDLRLHAVISSNNYANLVSFLFGITYNFDLTKTIKNRKK